MNYLQKWLNILPKETVELMFNLKEKVYQNKDILPEEKDVFKTLELTNPDNVKVIILGQDPYPTPGNAMGLAFSVTKGNKIPMSLNNIFKELISDIGLNERPVHGDLTAWCKEGVLLLNTILTVKSHWPSSHKSEGWQEVTDAIIRAVLEQNGHKVFITWGADAQKTANRILDEKTYDVTQISSSHPSPLSCTKTTEPFIGSKPFSKCNKILKQHNIKPVNWLSIL